MVETDKKPLAAPPHQQWLQALKSRDLLETIGWLLAIIMPLFAYHFLPPINPMHAQDEPKIFLCVISCASVMWAFSLLPELVPMFFIILTTAMLSLVDPAIILSGFSSSTFIILLGISALTVGIMQSGALKRFILYFMQTSSFQRLNTVFFCSGVIVSPLLPSIINRCQLLGALLSDISSSIKITPGSKPFLRMFTNGFFSITLFSSSFLTASLMNFIIFSVLPIQEQQTFQSGGWFLATIVLTVFLLISYLILFFCFLRSSDNVVIREADISENLKRMGPIKKSENFTTLCLIALFLGMLTVNYHHIPQSWLSFSILFLLLVLNHVNINDFQRNIDWSFILFLCSLVSLSQTFKSLKLDVWLFEGLVNHFPEMLVSRVTLFSSMIAITLILRFFLPIGAVVALLIPSAISIAYRVGISAWPLCFTILFIADIWFLPYQCTFYKVYKNPFGEAFSFERKFLLFNAIMNIFKILAILTSLPYWKYLSII
ncbi:SLC13 family permease [Candidatus Paracaedibacter symbiosus]|uniref:SLC13 family permease n=1 Tax=Candidatus Paracaedibacter symbiosus TaxID=244582 RepID=UPI0005095898|nr:SLC13 family permease [Candidatus Paracaedibacter symbiosus]